MRVFLPALPLLASVCLTATAALADDLRFAVVPKLQQQQFFREIRVGCMEEAAKTENVACVYRGPTRADFRLQDKVISDLIDQGVDGIAVAVINSVYLSKHSLKKAREHGVTVITVDSDLEQSKTLNPDDFRSTYVGTDNVELGRMLGQQLLSFGSKGTYSVITGNPTDYNLYQRLVGVYDVLKDSGWQEYPRSPFYAKDDPAHSLRVLDFLYKIHEQHPRRMDAVVSLTAAMQSSEDLYRQHVKTYKNRHTEPHFFVASSDASPHQLRHLREGLTDVHVGQQPQEMGRMAMRLLYKLHKGEPVKRVYHTPLRVCRRGQDPMCQSVK